VKKFKCKLCRKRGKTWKGSNPVCAFDENGKFVYDNWNCAMMNKLRELIDNPNVISWTYRDDMSSASIGVIKIPEEVLSTQGYLVMTWYKSRGRTSRAYIMCDEMSPEELTLQVAEEIIMALDKEVQVD